MKKRWLSVPIILSSGLLAGCSFVNPGANRQSKSTNQKTTSQPVKASFENNILKTNQATIKITAVKTTRPNQTYPQPIITFIYKTTNNGSTSITPQSTWKKSFNALQQGNQLPTTTLKDPSIPDNNQRQLQSNQSVENATSYQLKNQTDPVTLQATISKSEQPFSDSKQQNLDTITLGSQIYNIKQ
ncbi:hypothetical protein B808_850 [Fructilactobacillus florum 8D]|uniref:DUF5067 domain-containing protein n=2 Tax=Fructilactobacillus florum TaxID=640331 RepID=W9EKN7_9LACO|nr:DUF5067 domain-containing protein [Fructilactobacillus florum]EKK21072.1 hypothetical protein B807_141 [Fructilactobacillus florum 2F]ETO40239.1 hypothetical protein B808_850 [Fructilactobacillus florum 8D]KRM91346.1 hypothetical protein FC87_GL000855 [Fructilactobacillus florum DSM 22689 = JCM 16035]